MYAGSDPHDGSSVSLPDCPKSFIQERGVDPFADVRVRLPRPRQIVVQRFGIVAGVIVRSSVPYRDYNRWDRTARFFSRRTALAGCLNFVSIDLAFTRTNGAIVHFVCSERFSELGVAWPPNGRGAFPQ